MLRAYSHHVAIARRIVFAMQLQIHKAEPKLPHLRIRAAVSAGANHLPEQILGNRLSGLVMPREEIQRLALPAPVLHDLAGQFDEIPRYGRARQAAHFNTAQHMMQQMPELMEDGFHFAMRQQRRLLADRRSEIAAHATQSAVRTRPAVSTPVMKRFHPGAVALRFARIPVGIKRAEQDVVLGRALRNTARPDATPARLRASLRWIP